MVISVEEALNQIQKNIEPKVNELEGFIEKEILASKGNFPIRTTKLNGENQMVINQVINNYSNAGWEIKFKGVQQMADPRETSYYTIEPKRVESRTYTSSLASQIEAVENSKDWGPYS